LSKDLIHLEKAATWDDVREIVEWLHIDDKTQFEWTVLETVALCRSLSEIESLYETGRNRGEQIAYIGKLNKLLSKIKRLLNESDPMVEKTIGQALAPVLSETLSSRGLRNLNPDASRAPMATGTVYDRTGRGATGEIEPTDGLELSRRRAEFEDNGLQILAAFVDAIDVPLREILEIEKFKGKSLGRQPNPYRRFVIRRALQIYDKLHSHKPQKSGASRFESYVTGVLQVMGISDDGVSSAIAREIDAEEQLRKRPPK
jgi:hypothetical protein